MKTGRLTILIFLPAVIVMTACKSSFKIQSERIYQSSFSRFESFKFFNPDNMPESNFAFSETNKKRIFDAVAGELKKRGYTSIQDADLIVKIQGGTSQEVEDRSSYYDRYGRYGYGGYPYYWYRDPWLYDDLSKKTTMIIIDVLDAGSKKLLWQGTGYGVLTEKPERVGQDLKKAIADIFSQFPLEPRVSN